MRSTQGWTTNQHRHLVSEFVGIALIADVYRLVVGKLPVLKAYPVVVAVVVVVVVPPHTYLPYPYR